MNQKKYTPIPLIYLAVIAIVTTPTLSSLSSLPIGFTGSNALTTPPEAIEQTDDESLLDPKTIAAIWGAITGTLGTIISLYAVRLTKKRVSPNARIQYMHFHKQSQAPFGLILQFSTVLSNNGLIPITVTYFELDLGRALNDQCRSWSTEYLEGSLLKFEHKAKETSNNAPVTINPSELSDKLYLKFNLNWKLEGEDVDGSRYTMVITPLLRGKYKIIAHLSTGEKVKHKGKHTKIVD